MSKVSVKQRQQLAGKIDPPKPGANSFHFFLYEQKINLGDNYNYKKALSEWKKLSDKQKKTYKESAQEQPKHKKTKGALRGVSAYDVLRRDLRNMSEQDIMDFKDMNRNTLASKIRKHLDEHSYAWGENGEKWLTTPTEEHYKIIKRVIKEQQLLN
tara:strand:+ start:1726 stop:2193 length:468 start_codon:yes stop_codon:yes gene_type:complete